MKHIGFICNFAAAKKGDDFLNIINMKRPTFLRVLTLLVAIVAAGIFMPLYAQSDEFFRGSENNNRAEISIPGTDSGITNNGIGQDEAPLGSGLLILVAAGAGYAVARRKRNFKGTALFLALAMMLGLTQCRKDVITPSTPEGVFITLNVGDNSKVDVNPTGGNGYATVTFTNGDQIYVGNNGKYVGTLTFDGTNFTGTITPTSGDEENQDYLHFYFMGNKRSQNQYGNNINPSVNKTTAIYVNISDQTSEYPVISYAPSTEKYNSEITSYKAKLFNKCAIVKFSPKDSDNAAIDAQVTIAGMNNRVMLDFTKYINNTPSSDDNPYSYDMVGSGKITLHAGSDDTERWAILLPQDATTTTALIPGGFADNVSVPAISKNTCLTDGIGMTFETGVAVFLSPTGHRVEVATGNLQCKNNGTDDNPIYQWRFAENQYDIAQTSNGNWNTSDWIDIFGWGTWTGSNPTPFKTWTDDAQYTFDENDFVGTINGKTGWHTMTYDECNWFFAYGNKYSDRSEKVGLGTVNGVHGLVVLPDNWLLPTESSFVPQRVNQWNTNVYTIDQWAVMEAAGAIFLPAAGHRMNEDTPEMSNVGDFGYYWANTLNSAYQTQAWVGKYYTGQITVTGELRNRGCSVRLIRNLD